jgi:acetolactate synthase-1/2/3 large subunit
LLQRGVLAQPSMIPELALTYAAEPAHDAPARAADAVVDALVGSGVETFFGVPGGPISPIFDAVLRNARARLVESRQETAAAFAAMGHHRATGRVACVLVTAGPGATNAVTGVAAAYSECVPLLVIAGDVTSASRGERLLQDSGSAGLDIEQMLRSVTNARLRLLSPSSAAGHALAALREATNPARLGPVLLVAPIDVVSACVAGTRVAEPVRSARGALDAPDLALVKHVVERLVRAERPLLVVGAGSRGNRSEVERLVNALDVPFVTTPRAKGILSECHARSLRNGGLAASRWARAYTARGVDAALVLGTDLDDCSIGSTPFVREGGELVHVDRDARVFGRNLPTTLGVVADLGAFAESAALELDRSSLRHRNVLPELDALRGESPFDVGSFRSDSASPLAPYRALADLEAAAGTDARFVTDIGEHMLFALHYLTADSPERFTIHLGLGSMGSGIGSALGLALGDPRRRVVCVCGDGGMQMHGMEALVAVKERLNVVFAVFNDSRYNMVYHGYRRVFSREAPWESPRVDFATWAHALGVPAARIEHPGQITARRLDELSGDGPCLLDIRIDRNVAMTGGGRNEALLRMSFPSAGAT